MQHRFMRQSDILRRLRIGKSTLYRWMDNETFPHPVRLNNGSNVWMEVEVEKWVKGRVREGRLYETSHAPLENRLVSQAEIVPPANTQAEAAKPVTPVTPVEAAKPVEAVTPVEAAKPVEPVHRVKPFASKLVEAVKPADNPAEGREVQGWREELTVERSKLYEANAAARKTLEAPQWYDRAEMPRFFARVIYQSAVIVSHSILVAALIVARPRK